MTKEQVIDLESRLADNGYKLYKSCLSSSEDYGYFKSFDITYDEYGDKQVGYQVEFRFWDWRKYRQTGKNEFGVDIIVINSKQERCDLVLTTWDYDIDKTEQIAADFNEFCKKHVVGRFATEK